MRKYFIKAKPFYKLLAISVIATILSFKKINNTNIQLKNIIGAKSYSSQVLEKWMAMQIRLMSNVTASFNGPVVRIYSYNGIAAYASIYPGISRDSISFFLLSRLNNFPVMPMIENGKKYHWPCSANAAMAYMNRVMFHFISPGNKLLIDSLEISLKTEFVQETDASTIERSVAYGQEVAQRIFNRSETDGYRQSNAP